MIQPNQVHCPRCEAAPGKPCTTLYSKRAVSPHKPRIEVAKARVTCWACGGRPYYLCVDANGSMRTFMHRSRLRALTQAGRSVVNP